MSKSAARVAAAEHAARLAASKIIVAEFAEGWPEWHIWLTSEGRSIVATRIGAQRPPDNDERWAKSLIADTLDELQAQLVEQRELFSVAART